MAIFVIYFLFYVYKNINKQLTIQNTFKYSKTIFIFITLIINKKTLQKTHYNKHP